MMNIAPRSMVVSLGICLFLAGFVLLGTGCPVDVCTSDAQCAEGQVCNLETGECEAAPEACTSDDDCAEGETCDVETGECVAGPTGCVSDDDCADDEFCDLTTGECIVNENLYATVTFDHDGFHMTVASCDTCHHAGMVACDTCHGDEFADGIVSLKDAQHNPDNYGCWSCHEDAGDDCSFCHTDLP